MKLTSAAIAKLKAGAVRREIADDGARGLYLVVQPSGTKSWALRFRRPDGRPGKLTLGPLNSSGAAASEPILGGPLSLVMARELATLINRQRAAGIDVIVAAKADKRRAEPADTFGQVVRDYVSSHKVRRTGERPRNWRVVARVLGLRYPPDGGEPALIRGGLAERWADKPIGEIDGHDVHAAIAEAVAHGTPGIAPRNGEASEFPWEASRQRARRPFQMGHEAPARGHVGQSDGVRVQALTTTVARSGADGCRDRGFLAGVR